MVITLNICKICVHSHKSYIVYTSLCKVCLITFSYRENAHMSHFIHHVFSGLKKSLHISILYQSVVGIFGKFPNWHLYQSKVLVTHWQICGLQSKFQFLPQLSIKSISINTACAGYLGNFALAPILCSNLQLVMLLNGKFLLFLSLFGTLAIKAMAFWEISIFSQQNLSFLKSAKWVM